MAELSYATPAHLTTDEEPKPPAPDALRQGQAVERPALTPRNGGNESNRVLSGAGCLGGVDASVVRTEALRHGSAREGGWCLTRAMASGAAGFGRPSSSSP